MTALPSALPPVAPARGTAAAADGSSSAPQAAEGFLALLTAALPGAAGAQATEARPSLAAGGEVDPTTGEGPAVAPTALDDTGTDAGAEAADPGSDPGAASSTPDATLPLLAPMPFAVSEAVRLQTAPALQQPVTDEALTVSAATTTGDTTHAPPDSPSPGAGPGTATSHLAVAADPAVGPAPSPDNGTAAATTASDADLPAGAPGTSEPGTTDPGTAEAPRGQVGVGTGTPGGTPGAGALNPNGVDVSTLTQVTGSAHAAPTSATATSSTAQASAATPVPVAQQVFGEVGRLVTRGDGTHRLSMTLSPESLGDVRVTLTVRNGAVTVTFAAGDEAQRALLESTPELRRLLELTGATESRITVRDSAGAAQASSQTSFGQGGQSGQGGQGTAQNDPENARESGAQDPTGQAGAETPEGRARAGSGDHQDHHAGTRDGQNAMDGDHRGAGDTRRPHDPVTSTRPAGLDVTV